MDIKLNTSMAASIFLAALKKPELSNPDLLNVVEDARPYVANIESPRSVCNVETLRALCEPDLFNKEGHLLGLLACLCLEHPDIFNYVLTELNDNTDIRLRLAFELISVCDEDSYTSVKIDLLAKMLNDSDETIRLAVINGLSKYAYLNPDKVGQLALIALNDKSVHIVSVAISILGRISVNGSLACLDDLIQSNKLRGNELERAKIALDFQGRSALDALDLSESSTHKSLNRSTPTDITNSRDGFK